VGSFSSLFIILHLKLSLAEVLDLRGQKRDLKGEKMALQLTTNIVIEPGVNS